MKNILLISLFLLAGTVKAKNYQWRQLAHYPPLARHQQAAFAIGNQVYYGMGHYNSGPQGNICFNDFWAYDPATNSWTQKADYIGDPVDGTADFVIGNKAYVGTGTTISAYGVKDFYEYDPQTNTWTQKADFMGSARRMAIGFAIGDYGYIGSGNPGGSDFYRYDPVNDQWQMVAPIPQPMNQSTEFVIGNNAYVGTGGNANFYKYTPLPVDTWVAIAPLPGIATWRAACTAFVIDGKGYAGMGVAQPGPWHPGNFFEYDPANDTWTDVGKFGGQKRHFMEAVAIGDKAYMGMGTDGTNYNDFWVWEDVPLDTIPEDTTSVVPDIHAKLTIKIFPNPTTGTFTVHGTTGTIEVLDNQGRLVLTTTNPQIYMRGYTKGLYFVRVGEVVRKLVLR